MRLLLALLLAVQTVFPPAPSVVRTTPREFPVGSVLAAVPPGSTLLNDLVAYWPLDETSGTRYDSVGDNDLTDNNTVGMSLAGPSGTVASFVAGNSESLSKAAVTMAADYTVAGWVNVTDDGNINYFFSCGTWVNNVQIALAGRFDAPNTGHLQATIGDGSDYKLVIGDSLAGGWHLVLASYDSATKKISVYVDAGTAATSDALAGAARDATAATLYLGNFTDGTTYDLNGKMANWGYWSRVLTAGERTSLFNSGVGKKYSDLTTAEKVGLVSYWDLSETSGTRADSHGANDLTDNNTVGSVVNAGGAMHNAAASFVAANSERLTRNAIVYPTASDFTIAAWVKKTDSVADQQYFITDNSVPYTSYGYGFAITNNILAGWGAAGVDIGDSAGQWVLCFSEYNYATTSIRFMAMGSPSNSGVWSAATNVGQLDNAYFAVGSDTAFYNRLMNGLIDEVAIWSRVLTSDERAELYNLGKGKFHPTFN